MASNGNPKGGNPKGGKFTQVLVVSGVATVGGYAGTKLTTALEVGMAKKGNANAGMIAPGITEAIGLMVQIFSPNPILSAGGLGMSAVAGTELLEKLEMRMTKPKAPAGSTTTTTTSLPESPENVAGQSRVPAFNGQTRVPAFQGSYRRY